jgi:hypothetical protein
LLQLEHGGCEKLPVKDGDRYTIVDLKKLLNGIDSPEKRNSIISMGNVIDSQIIAGDENMVNA